MIITVSNNDGDSKVPVVMKITITRRMVIIIVIVVITFLILCNFDLCF